MKNLFFTISMLIVCSVCLSNMPPPEAVLPVRMKISWHGTNGNNPIYSDNPL